MVKRFLGKVDYRGTGKRYKAYVEFELSPDGNFTMSGEIWNTKETDIVAGGQMVNELVKYFPHDTRLKRMVEIWERWHLNDMKAGTPAQEFAIADWLKHNGNEYEYTAACDYLQSVGLYTVPDPRDYTKTYRYGHAWLKEEIPENVKATIRAW